MTLMPLRSKVHRVHCAHTATPKGSSVVLYDLLIPDKKPVNIDTTFGGFSVTHMVNMVTGSAFLSAKS